MEKTFKHLTVGDLIYEVYGNDMQFKEHSITAVESDKIKFGYGTINRENKSILHVDYFDRRSRITHFFVHRQDVFRFCKAQMMKNLFEKINNAKQQINEIKQFRSSHFELLNHTFTECEINKLEKELAY